MRFEFLFLGYLLMFQLAVDEITILPAVGYALMLFAMLRLQRFEPAFEKAKKVLYFAIPLGCALLGLQIYKTFAGETAFVGYDFVYAGVRLASEITEMLTMLFVYVAVKNIGVNAEIRSLEKHSSRNMAVMGVYFVLETVMTILSLTLSDTTKETEIFRISMIYPFAVGLIWRILNLWMIITCYLGVEIDDGSKKKAPEEQKKKINHRKRKKR